MRNNIEKMNADQARLKYFNYYVEFERLIRGLADSFGIKSSVASTSLSDVLYELTPNLKNVKQLKLRSHKNVRNWLAHTPKNKFINDKEHLLCESISNVLSLLKQILIK